MSFAIQSEPIPLQTDSDGTVRVGGTRVTLDTVINAHLHGATPPDIARQYPAIQLADVYAVLGYYLRHTAAVDAYLREREQAADQIRQEMEKQFDPAGVRERLEQRRTPTAG
jgi:uncharacterized protein (DUF433 family)